MSLTTAERLKEIQAHFDRWDCLQRDEDAAFLIDCLNKLRRLAQACLDTDDPSDYVKLRRYLAELGE